MNTDTLYFRVSLSIVAIWISVWGYLIYQSYQGDYRDPSMVSSTAIYIDDAGEGPTSSCYDSQLDFRGQGGEEMYWRQPTQQETNECVSNVIEMETRFAREANTSFLWESWKEFFLIGVAPALALLFAVAFWANLSGGGLAIGKRYLDWLRYGSKRPEE